MGIPAICKAMLQTGIYPDFIVVDGNEGGTGAAPLEFMDHLGMPMREGVSFVHNALIGINARDRIKIGAAGKIATAFDMARAMAIGADWCNSARGFMFALGCIQSLSCHTDRCPTGVTTQDPSRAPRAGGAAQDRAGLHVPSRHPARAVRASRRRRPRPPAATAADPLLEANLEHRGDVISQNSIRRCGRAS
jgi:glutamate synthase domain-containing protein 2